MWPTVRKTALHESLFRSEVRNCHLSRIEQRALVSFETVVPVTTLEVDFFVAIAFKVANRDLKVLGCRFWQSPRVRCAASRAWSTKPVVMR